MAMAPAPDHILEIRDLRTHFFTDKGVVRAVDGVTLDLTRKTTLGIVGESGCGKSVTASSIMRLLKEPPGKIVDGEIRFYPLRAGQNAVDIAQLDPRGPEIREIRGGEISMIFQEPMTSLNPLFTVGRQIAESVMLHQHLDEQAALERALEMLQLVHMSDPRQRLKQYPHQLSGGMRQRVMIALALSCNPAILIADEPTTALDVTVQAQILDLMRQLQDEFDSAIVMITHNLGVVSQMADEVAVMYFGKVVEHGPTRAIFHNPLHPYTQGLLQSIPVLGRKRGEMLIPIEGMVPAATADIRGCSFAARCPHAMNICREQPPVTTPEDGHSVACWLHH